MSILLDKMIQPGKVNPPKYILSGFLSNFPDALNPEWHHCDVGFEAIFQENGSELIAVFNKYGALVELRKTVIPADLPPHIFEAASRFGELMNLIKLTKKKQVAYEIIYRDKQLNRFLLLMGDDGTIIHNDPL